MQSSPDGEFKFILVYQDHGAKFCYITALPDKKRKTVALVLLAIFGIIGPPFILQSDNGREFAKIAGGGKLKSFGDDDIDAIVSELADMWPECRLVHGRARHSESQGGVERLNQTAQRRLAAWRRDNPKASWARVGVNVVMWGLNSTHTKSINMVPYEYVFGQRPMCGISDLPLSPAFIAQLQTEQDVEDAVAKVSKAANKHLPQSSSAKAGRPAKGGVRAGAQQDPEDGAAARTLLVDNEEMLAVYDSMQDGASRNAKRLLARILALPTSKSTSSEPNAIAFEAC